MSWDLEPIMATLQALAKDTPRSAKERQVAAEKAIKSWLAQTNDLADAGIGTGAYGGWPPRGCRPLKKAPAMWPGPSGTSITPIIRRR